MRAPLSISLLLLAVVGCGGSEAPEFVDGPPIYASTYAINLKSFPIEEFIAQAAGRPVYHQVVAGNVFGRNYSNLRTLYNQANVKETSFFLDFPGCLRQQNQNCQPDTINFGLNFGMQLTLVDTRDPSLMGRYIREAQEVIDLLGQYPEIECVIFPELESNLNADMHDILVEAIRPVVSGRCRIGYNPNFRQDSKGLADVYQGHRQLNTPMPCFASNDGISIDLGTIWEFGSMTLEQLEAYFAAAQCERSFPWHHSLSNCLNDGASPAPRERRCLDGDWGQLISAVL